jgi:hypothetical protein
MLRHTFAIALFATTLAPVAVSAAEPVAAAATAAPAAYSVAETSIGTLLDDAASKAIVDKHIPGFSTNPQVEMARGMTLKAIQSFAADVLTDEAFAKIDADLLLLAAKK